MIPIVFGTLEWLFKSGTVANLAYLAWLIYTKVGYRKGWQAIYEFGNAGMLSQLEYHLPKKMTSGVLWRKVEATLPSLITTIKTWRETK